MIITKFDDNKIKQYLKLLKSTASLSLMFADSDSPYLNYRATENIFCRIFDADNLSRKDCSIDARIGDIGIGIKTFLSGSDKTYQKIAEFNRDSKLLENKEPRELAKVVSKLRNERLLATQRIYGVNEMFYHCVTRKPGMLNICECSMDFIETKKIKKVENSSSSVIFSDGINDYLFNKSKSTLFKRFYTHNPLYSFDVKILSDPYRLIQQFDVQQTLYFNTVDKTREYVVLPLYSERGGISVPEKSGLNQWNASGRPRNYNEVYIQVPSLINKKFPEFFPPRDTPFILNLPDKKHITAKICQDNNKALMSNPNKDLGEWILRQVLNLSKGELLTYNRLIEIGLDSVIIYKENNNVFSIDFLEVGEYERFKSELD